MSAHERKDGRRENRLARESSPYLLQHARNPVDWFAWGEEAFAEARRRDVPIFLSIGYSTCYWCHVMERECFEDGGVAKQMNEGFVCVKVDREERPDVDDVFMAGTVVTTGHGGWPMSVFLEPHGLKPFLCGTYFPKVTRAEMGERPSFPMLMASVSQAWKERREDVLKQAEAIGAAIGEELGGSTPAVALDATQVGDAVSTLLRMFDAVDGGFSRAPKFPQAGFLEFLLDVRGHVDEDSRGAIDRALRLTLDRMACGGIFDQVGGGFHRYSVDAHWIVPHFEKMLYDQAQLAQVYARASVVFGDVFYASVARRTLDFVLREMTDGDGAFFSAIDAEVDSREGLNYLWTKDEVLAAAGELGEFACRVFGVDRGVNFKDPHHADEPARNVLCLSARPEVLAGELMMSSSVFDERLSEVQRRLARQHATRRQPAMDDKVLTAWNGLVIGAMARCGGWLEEERFVQAAARACESVRRRVRSADGRLGRSWRGGRIGALGVLEDYACLADGLLALQGQRGSAEVLGWAREIMVIVERDFAREDGGFFDGRGDGTGLFVRTRSTHDGAAPSASSVLLHALIDFAGASGDAAGVSRAIRLLASMSGAIAASPVSTINATRGLLRLLLVQESARELAGMGPAAGERVAPLAEGEEFTPVEIYAATDRVVVGPDAPGRLSLVVRIGPGYHVVAAEPGVEGLAPFRVGIVGGKGVAAYADYPQGVEHGVESVGRVRVYEGEVELEVALEVTGAIEGRPLIGVTYQACSGTECLRPRRVELDVAIDGA